MLDVEQIYGGEKVRYSTLYVHTSIKLNHFVLYPSQNSLGFHSVGVVRGGDPDFCAFFSQYVDLLPA